MLRDLIGIGAFGDNAPGWRSQICLSLKNLWWFGFIRRDTSGRKLTREPDCIDAHETDHSVCRVRALFKPIGGIQ
jgi:hypothetical protein